MFTDPHRRGLSSDPALTVLYAPPAGRSKAATFRAMGAAKSPMMQQFEAAKARCPGALVLFRMGDFYELFGDDAREAAELLDLTVTSREKGPDAMPIAGFPHHQLDPQLVKLVAAGRRVAICEQIDDPKTTKGLLRREVTRIVTPGIAAD